MNSNKKLLTQFIDFIENQKNYSKHTVRAYQVDISQLINYLGDDLEIIKMNKYDLHEYASSLSKSISSKSLSRKVATLKSFFRFLVDEEFIKINYSKGLLIPKIEKKLPNYLTVKEMRTFFKKTLKEIDISLRDLLIIDIIYSTGIRVSECAKIITTDIDLDKKTIKVLGKGNKSRIVIFGEKTKINLNRYLDEIKSKEFQSKFLFFSPHNKNRIKRNCISTRTIYNIVKKYIKLVSNNEKLGPHSLRHSFATHLLQGGSDLMAIKDLLGHESLSSTQIYTHLDTKRMKEIYDKSHPHAK